MARRLTILTIAIGLLCCPAVGNAWPDLHAVKSFVDFMTFDAVQDDNNSYLWHYYLGIDPDAPIGGDINVGGVKALAIYFEGGERGADLPGLDDVTIPLLSGWGIDGGYDRAAGAAGFLDGPPFNYIHKGDYAEVGTIDFSAYDYMPTTTSLYAAHLDWGYEFAPGQNTEWVTQIPEPTTFLLLGSGVGLAALLRRRKKKT